MDPHSFIARAEAQRWIGIAEKLLMANDLVGSKTFAIRARESDARLEAADQILAIADTLLAAEKRVVVANGSEQLDFYAILQLVRFAQDTDHIASQYRRLAVMLNPHQNRFPYSDQAFQLVNEAWAVLSNPMRKSLYDSDLDFPQQQQMNSLGFNLEQQHHQQQHQHNFFSINHMATNHEQELHDSQQTFQSRVQQGHQQQQQLQQHNFLSQNPVRPIPVRDQEQMFQPRDQGNLFQQHVQPFQVTSIPPQQNRPPPQPPRLQPQSPPSQHSPFSWPQPQAQPHPLSHPQAQPHQQFQQQQEASSVHIPSHINSNNGAREKQPEPVPVPEAVPEAEPAAEAADENVDDSPSFWTTCPYCLYLYEYPKAYTESVLRCVTCKRAFQAIRIASPPSVTEGQDSYFCCWGFFPLAVSMSELQEQNGTRQNPNWTPFSPMYDVSKQVQDRLNDLAASKKNPIPEEDLGPRINPDDEKKKTNSYPKDISEPVIYIDDVTDDIFSGISEPSEDSDTEWNTPKKKTPKRIKKARVVTVTDSRNRSSKTVSSLPSTKGSAGVTTRRQLSRAAMGKLDLNVEFHNNDGEEPAARVGSGNRGNGPGGDGDANIEGNGFFEGLDEFFSTLPILNVVNDEKVKAG